MKHVADTAFAMACIVLVAVVARNHFLRADDVPRAREGLIPVGTSVPGIDAPTLVVYLSPSCAFCQDSMPFYRRLSARVRTGVAPRLAFPLGADEPTFKAYLANNGLDPDDATAGPLVPGVRATPTIVLVSEGVVAASWVGRLSAEQEEELLSGVR